MQIAHLILFFFFDILGGFFLRNKKINIYFVSFSIVEAGIVICFEDEKNYIARKKNQQKKMLKNKRI